MNLESVRVQLYHTVPVQYRSLVLYRHSMTSSLNLKIYSTADARAILFPSHAFHPTHQLSPFGPRESIQSDRATAKQKQRDRFYRLQPLILGDYRHDFPLPGITPFTKLAHPHPHLSPGVVCCPNGDPIHPICLHVEAVGGIDLPFSGFG